jgi:hypothetical protein
MKERKIAWVSIILLTVAAFAAEPVATTTTARTSAPQPLSYAGVTSHFRSAGLRATEVQKRCTVFFEGEWKNASVYDYGLIIVENSDEDLQITFYLTDAHEMNWITEFLDAPFFSRAETLRLFDLVNSRHDARDQAIGRFRVDFHRWLPRHAEIIVFSFSRVGTRN